MAQGLAVSRLVNVQVNLSPLSAQSANFNALVVIGDSDVIGIGERIRSYNNADEVALDFGIEAPEFRGAQLFFMQTPRPTQIYIGRWARTPTHARLTGGVLNAVQQDITAWNMIANGSFSIAVDGVVQKIEGLNFTAETNLNGVASKIDAKLVGASVVWDGSRFAVKSESSGEEAQIGYATSTGNGTDLSAKLKLTQGTASAPVDGALAETPAECLAALMNVASVWYGATFAASVPLDDDAHYEAAALIQGSGRARIFGISSNDSRFLDRTIETDLASRLKDAGFTRTVVQYSHEPHVICSFFGRAFTTNFNANRSMITMMFKQEPGVSPENLSPSQADSLIAKRVNFFARYNNGTAILQNGVMSAQSFFDEIHGTDWLQNRIETDVWNLLYTSPTKIPQTEEGNARIYTEITSSINAGINNGLVAPGTWNSAGFGTLTQGDFLPQGFYIYALPVSFQSQADREARKSVPFQVAIKLSGAIHSVDILVNVNR